MDRGRGERARANVTAAYSLGVSVEKVALEDGLGIRVGKHHCFLVGLVQKSPKFRLCSKVESNDRPCRLWGIGYMWIT